ncbi:MAG: two-component system response regulator [Cohnella sp.]|jgi:two-component system response regulator YesN|nr:two-component system response regulator [Cohnella sp.]
MYKILIVDDEKEIRDGLAAWTWDNLGIELTGCFAHGLEALQYVERHPVDIVMTDIRMPFMDGIELMENLLRAYPFTNVIILSGHSDFDYAQKAIKHGAEDYLLKPIHFPTLSRTLEELVGKMDAKKQENYRLSVLKRKEQLLTKVLREDFLSRLLHDRMTTDEMEHGSAEGEVLLDADSYTVAVFRLDRLASPQKSLSDRELQLFVFSLDNILQDIWDLKDNGYHKVDRRSAEFYLLSKSRQPHEAFAAVQQQLVKYIGLFRSTFSAGIGHSVGQASHIHLSARAGALALQQNREECSFSVCEEEQIRQASSGSDAAAFSGTAEGYKNADLESIILKQARQYISDHYHRSLTLKEVADHVYVSPGHLSALFKDADDTFMKFLTSLRMCKAMELLADSSYKVYEIVDRVGYSDPAYFSEIFKKYTGKTPNEYRGKSRPA